MKGDEPLHRTLYVSDLDGTLLRSDQRTSDYTNQVINSLVEKGMVFSYATARSLVTAKKVTQGLNARIPLILYNGAFILDNRTEEIIDAAYFDETVNELLDRLFAEDIYPIVYAYIDGKEKFSFVPELASSGVKAFADSRKGDIRTNIVHDPEELRKGNKFYITCIGDPAKLKPLYDAYKDKYHCVYQVDIYTRDQWLEIMPKEASKANAVTRLKTLLGCDKVIAFGDGKNDTDMFEIADLSYAVANADEELKKLATAIIRSNDEDGVARFLEENYKA
ncbi:MAG: HAD family hydrolase [Clostridia bacterium]|nr:HAD family hydrolase [Clostridia bacterium]